MSQDPAEDVEVAIIGGGPVGLGLAAELGLRGISCAVVERQAEMHRVPKGQNLTQRTLEHFHFWGAEAALRSACPIPSEVGIGGLTAYGALNSEHVFDWLQRDWVGAYYFTANARAPQYVTETVLRRRVAELPTVRTLFGWSAEHVGQDDAGPFALLSDPSGARHTLRARYVVGCDGSRSQVRDFAGITETRFDHDRLMVLLVFRSEGMDRIADRYPGKSYFKVLAPDLDGYWRFFGRVDARSTWFFHAPVPAEARQPGFDFNACLEQAVGEPIDAAFDYIGFWELRTAVADTYRSGDIFIAGDAAHSHPPYGGYGVNTGLEDAVNLGWKLAATLRGWGGGALLDSYAAERRTVFVSTAHDFIEKSIAEDRAFVAECGTPDAEAFSRAMAARSQDARSEVDSFEPHYDGSPIVFAPEGGTTSALGSHHFTARPGHHLAPAPLTAGGDVYDRLGRGFTLLALDAPPGAASAFQAAADRLGVPLDIISDTRQDRRALYGAGLVLIRPDQFVAWVGDEAPQDAEAVLRRVTGSPAP
jgi:2-polyprenyl-6-methoxyphenol hydroxylase-like FAD-dependent oxidoreductase